MHRDSETVSATSTVVQKKSCILPELTSYTASFTNTAFATQTKENVQTEEATGHNLKKTEGVTASAAEKGNSTYWQCHDCNQYFSDEKAQNEIKKEDTVLEKIAPVIIEGDGASVTADEKKTVSFRSDAAFEDFIRVEVDGKTVDESDYTVKSGSTIVTLKEKYIASLSEGEHVLGIVSESGTATAKFVVNQKAEEDSKKEDTEDPKKEDVEESVTVTKDTPTTEESTTTKTTPTTKTQSSQVKATPVTKAATTTAAKTAAATVTKTAPKTGDYSQMLLCMSLFLASLGIIAGVGIKKKKEMEA